MDEAANQGRDTSGSDHHATVFGAPDSIGGKVLAGSGFNGRSYLELAPTPTLDGAAFGSFTVAAWIRPAHAPPRTDNTNAAYTIFAGRGGLELKYRFDRRFVASIGTSTKLFEMVSAEFSPGTWHLVAMVVDETQNALALYVNGLPAPGSPVAYSGARAQTHSESPNHRQYYGHYRIAVRNPLHSWESSYFIGGLDEVRFYGRALSQTEVQTLH